MILPDMKTVFRLNALAGNTRSYNLGQAVDIDRMKVESFFDLFAHRICPWFGTKDPDLK